MCAALLFSWQQSRDDNTCDYWENQASRFVRFSKIWTSHPRRKNPRLGVTSHDIRSIFSFLSFSLNLIASQDTNFLLGQTWNIEKSSWTHFGSPWSQEPHPTNSISILHSKYSMDGWMGDFIYADPTLSVMQPTTTICNRLRTSWVYHFLNELRASPRPVVA